MYLRGNGTVATRPRLSHATRRPSWDRDDAVEASHRRRRADPGKFKFIFHAESVPEQIGNDLVLLVAHAAAKMRHALVRLLGVAQILRGNDGVARRPSRSEKRRALRDDGVERSTTLSDAIAAIPTSSSSMTPTRRRLRDEHVAHGQHAQAPELLRRVKDDGREARRHF